MPRDYCYNFLNRRVGVEGLSHSSHHFVAQCMRVRITLPCIMLAELIGDAVGSIGNKSGLPLEVLRPTTRLLREVHVVVVVVEVEIIDLIRINHVAYFRELFEGAVVGIFDGENN